MQGRLPRHGLRSLALAFPVPTGGQSVKEPHCHLLAIWNTSVALPLEPKRGGWGWGAGGTGDGGPGVVSFSAPWQD